MTSKALFSSATDDWPTPQHFFDRLNEEFDFALDVCASTTNHKAPAYYALDHKNKNRRDGLAGDWVADIKASGKSGGFMNPPYGKNIGAWMTKARETAQAGTTMVCLVPVRSGTIWWHELVLDSGAEVRYVRGRLAFGAAKSTAPFCSAVVIYRPTDKPGSHGPSSTMPARLPRNLPAPEAQTSESSKKPARARSAA